MNRKTAVGGQAVLEGVMMRSPKCLAIAVRRENGEIVVREDVWRSIWDRLKFLRWPFLRGVVVMIESMVNGVQALNFSAQQAMSEQEKAEQEAAGKESKLSTAAAIVIPLILVIALFKLLPHLAATYTGELLLSRPLTVDDFTYHVVDGFVKIAIFIGYVLVIGQIKEIKRVFMYHGAEHMAVYTFEAGEAPTVENAQRKSPLHPRCGTAFLLVVMVIFIAVAAMTMPFVPQWAKPMPDAPWYRHLLLVLFKLPLLIPVAGVAYEFNRFAGRHADNLLIKPLLLPGLAMQLLTTKQPTADQLEIALTALTAALGREQAGTETATAKEPLVFKDFNTFTHASAELWPNRIAS